MKSLIQDIVDPKRTMANICSQPHLLQCIISQLCLWYATTKVSAINHRITLLLVGCLIHWTLKARCSLVRVSKSDFLCTTCRHRSEATLFHVLRVTGITNSYFSTSFNTNAQFPSGQYFVFNWTFLTGSCRLTVWLYFRQQSQDNRSVCRTRLVTLYVILKDKTSRHTKTF